MAKLVHKYIRKIAREQAAEWYEEAAHDNLFYQYYPSMKFFVDKEWPKFIQLARTVLAKMLTGNYADSMKEEIFDILMKDRTLPQGDVTVH